MQSLTKRTFIPPQNRPTIRSAELRSDALSLHYLTVFNHPIRRKLFVDKILADSKHLDSSKISADQTSQPTCESIFGIPKNHLQGLLEDISSSFSQSIQPESCNLQRGSIDPSTTGRTRL